MKKIISNNKEIKELLEYFNDFHDGFLKSIKIISGNKFVQNAPWEHKAKYKSNEEIIKDTGLMYTEKLGLFLEIQHYNYDWPNTSPNNKIILYFSDVQNIDRKFIKMIGECIVDCHVENSGLNISFTFETIVKGNKPVTYKTIPLNFKKLYINEKR